MTSEQQNKIWDTVIVGGGPAGLAAALYLSRDLFSTLIIEEKVLGGMMAQTDRVDNYPAVKIGTSGFELSKSMSEQIKQAGAQVMYGRVDNIKLNNDAKDIASDARFSLMVDNQTIFARTVLLATGTQYRRLNVDGEAELIGKKIHFCATCDGPLYREKTVAVIGGGNSAVEEALFLSRFASRVYLLVREKITATQTLQTELMSEVKTGKIQLIIISSIIGFEYNDNQLIVRYLSNGQQLILGLDGVFVAIGIAPQTDLARRIGIECNENGYVKTNQSQTSLLGVFAAGDIVAGNDQQIAVATGDGVRAALRIRDFLRERRDN
ncbi:MAG: FAD-dependent oxidoreductase [Candidatus Saccharibacteria bacterium]|nr:FAD-dependent oxidoreductase [Candidatus Saccharibacteria bacterium]